MAKKKKRIDSQQGSLLDLLQRLQDKSNTEGNLEEGSLEISDKLRLAINAGIRQCKLSRWEIAGRMSHLLGREITKTQLDSWTAESKNGHRPPADAVTAFCVATQFTRPLQVLNEPAGLFTLPGPDALRSEIRKLEEERRRVVAEKRKREMFLKEMEGE